jgi:hypothetical protein
VVPDTIAFLVTDSNITYEKATLGTQVRQALAVQASGPPAQQAQPSATLATITAPSPSDSVPASVALVSPPGPGTTDAEVPPSKNLVGCVLHLTDDEPPAFVDRATYQSEQVYVIAVADEAWVVGIGCTASRPALITSVQLTSAG